MFATGLSHPQGIVVDGQGNVYEADSFTGNVFKYTSLAARTTFASGLNAPKALAFDPNGVLYVSEFGSHDILKLPFKTIFAPPSTTRFIGGIAFEPGTALLSNISTRASVQTVARVAIGGFIISGTQPKNVLIRGLGPTLARPPFNVVGILPDPTLALN